MKLCRRETVCFQVFLFLAAGAGPAAAQQSISLSSVEEEQGAANTDETADPDTYSRMDKAELLEETIDKNISRLGDEEPSLRWAGARALGSCGPKAERAVPALIDALASLDTPRISKTRKIKVNTVFKGVGAADSDERLESNCIYALGEIGPAAKEGIPLIIKGLSAELDDTRRNAVKALANMGPLAKPAVPELISLLKREGEGQMGLDAITALGKIGPGAKSAVPLLNKMKEGAASLRRDRISDALKAINNVKKKAKETPNTSARL